MSELIFLFATLVLAAGFLALVSFEARRGARVFARARAHFDEHVERAEFVATHVDWAAYANEQLKAFSLWMTHALAQGTLRLVRFFERLLSRTVRQLRARVASDTPPGETTRPFVQALSDFKEELRESRPDNIDAPPV